MNKTTTRLCSFRVIERANDPNRWDVRLVADGKETVMSVHNLKEDAAYGASRCRDCAKTFDPKFFDRPLLSWLEKFLVRLNSNFNYPDDEEVSDFRALQQSNQLVFLDEPAIAI